MKYYFENVEQKQYIISLADKLKYPFQVQMEQRLFQSSEALRKKREKKMQQKRVEPRFLSLTRI